jgi:FtsH-binding integral membrane protein
VARAPVQAALATACGAAYLATLLALDHFASYPEQLALGVVTCLVLLGALTRVSPERRAQALGVVAFATIGEAVGSLVWGVYRYRLHNLPLFVPPAHGIVYLSGFALSVAMRRHTRALVALAATAAATWGVLGLTVLSRRDVAGAIGVPLLLLFLWRSRNRAIYAGVFLVVASLELYGTAIGTWRWAPHLPGLGIPDGNPPSGVASGYVWFDVMALLVAPYILAATRRSSGAPHDDFRACAESHRGRTTDTANEGGP